MGAWLFGMGRALDTYITHYEGAEFLLLGSISTEMMRISTLSGLIKIVQTLAYIACAY